MTIAYRDRNGFRDVRSVTDYTLRDLDEARAEYERATECFLNYMGGNPKKHSGRMGAAAYRLDDVTAGLKAQGLIPKTEWEELCERLDAAFPNTNSKEIVEFEGRKYMRRFWPSFKSPPGRIKWDKGWELQ